MKKGIKFSDLSVLNFILFFIFYLAYAREEGATSLLVYSLQKTQFFPAPILFAVTCKHLLWRLSKVQKVLLVMHPAPTKFGTVHFLFSVFLLLRSSKSKLALIQQIRQLQLIKFNTSPLIA